MQEAANRIWFHGIACEGGFGRPLCRVTSVKDVAKRLTVYLATVGTFEIIRSSKIALPRGPHEVRAS